MRKVIDKISNIFEENQSLITEVYKSDILKKISKMDYAKYDSGYKKYDYRDVKVKFINRDGEEVERDYYSTDANSAKDLKNIVSHNILRRYYPSDIDQETKDKVLNSIEVTFSRREDNYRYSRVRDASVYDGIKALTNKQLDLANISDEDIESLPPGNAWDKRYDGAIFWVKESENKLLGVSFDGKLLFKPANSYDDKLSGLGSAGLGKEDKRSVWYLQQIADRGYFIPSEVINASSAGVKKKQAQRVSEKEGAEFLKRAEDVARQNKNRYREILDKRKKYSINYSRMIENVKEILFNKSRQLMSQDLTRDNYRSQTDELEKLTNYTKKFWDYASRYADDPHSNYNLEYLRDIESQIKNEYAS